MVTIHFRHPLLVVGLFYFLWDPLISSITNYFISFIVYLGISFSLGFRYSFTPTAPWYSFTTTVLHTEKFPRSTSKAIAVDETKERKRERGGGVINFTAHNPHMTWWDTYKPQQPDKNNKEYNTSAHCSNDYPQWNGWCILYVYTRSRDCSCLQTVW